MIWKEKRDRLMKEPSHGSKWSAALLLQKKQALHHQDSTQRLLPQDLHWINPKRKNNANLMSGIEKNWAKKKLCATIYKYRLRRTLVIKTGNKTPPPPPPSSSAPKECTVLSGVICNVHTLTDVAWCSYTRDRLDDVMALVHRSLQTHKNIALFYFTSLHLLHCLSHFLQRHFRVPCQ